MKYTVFKGTDREFTGNLTQISKCFNINIQTLSNRINQSHMSLEKAIDYKDYRFEKHTVFKGTDKEFTGTFKEICNHFNVNYYTAKTSKNKYNLTIEDAINYKIRKGIKHTVFKGTQNEITGTVRQICNKLNLNYSYMTSRILKYNLTLEEAIELPLEKVKQNNLTYKNQKGTMRELCKMFNKNYIEVYNKVKYNHTFEWAMDSTVNPYDNGE